jgi:hypothetical protein
MEQLAQSGQIGNSCPTFSPRRKLTDTQQALLWQEITKNPDLPSRTILERVRAIEGKLSISVRHFNRLRVQWGVNRGKGRPRGSESTTVSKGELLKATPNLRFVGVHILDDWMEHEGKFCEVVMLLKRSIEVYRTQHPQESFPLLHHRDQTLLFRFKALFYASLMGIGKLTEYDVKEHCLETLIGRGYQSSTLNQFLGQLERIEAGDGLMEALLPPEPGKLCYVDGHMIAFWTTASMHKGKITMLGRIMAGSQAVVAHNEDGHALLVDYYPPDIRLPRMILDYCQRIVSTTGIELFVIDREVNSVNMAPALTHE